jgi:hypothetical protein
MDGCCIVDFCIDLREVFRDLLTELKGFAPQLIVGEIFIFLEKSTGLGNDGLDPMNVLV